VDGHSSSRKGEKGCRLETQMMAADDFQRTPEEGEKGGRGKREASHAL